MELPILTKLKDRGKFDFQTLTDNFELTEQYWDWWWENEAGVDGIIRPETIEDSDPILEETINKTVASLDDYSEFFYEYLARLVDTGVFQSIKMSRADFHNLLLDYIGKFAAHLPDRPQIVFAGGGYGSGKTHTLGMLSKDGKLPVGKHNIIGVDSFKLFIPEYNLIQAVSDGRASLTVQKECHMLANRLFKDLVDRRQSFIWDSSMSNKSETFEKIKLVESQGYEMTMVAVLTPLEVATKQAMERAKEVRRFPHPAMLPRSHVAFREVFMDYVEHFDEVFVFANFREQDDTPLIVARKIGKKNALEILEPELFNRAAELPSPSA